VSATPTVVATRAQPDSASTLPDEPKKPDLHGVDTSKLTFVNRKGFVTVTPSSVRLKRTVEGASSIIVAVHDPDLEFLNSPALEGEHDTLESFVVLENQVFALSGIHIAKGHLIEATLEDEAVYRLRKNKKALTMSRGKATRAQFIKHIFAESGVPLNASELDTKQPIETVKEKETREEKNKKRKPGISDHAKLTVKGQPIDSEQHEVLEIGLAQAVQDNAGHLATLALICATIGEASARKDEVAHSQNGAQVGPWQSDQIPADKVAEQAHYFLIGGKSFQAGGAIHLAKTQPSLTPGDIATMVEASGEPGDFYNVYKAEAEVIVNAFTGTDASVLQNDTYVKAYQFERKAGEDTWTCAQRLAEEVGWYLFIVGGAGYFMSGKALKASRAQMLVAPGADGLLGNPTGGRMTNPNYDDTLTVECVAGKWQAPPGTVAEAEGYGPLNDRWIVTTIEREAMKSEVTIITLGRGKLPKKEPAHEVLTRAASEETSPEAAIPNSSPGPQHTVIPGASWNPARKPIATWIVPILQWASQHGWKGQVTSGYRTDAEQMKAATAFGLSRYGSGGPLASNHCGDQSYPKGAVDVSGGSELQTVLKGYTGTPTLKWGGDSIEDAVHYSATGD
jgi:hypothetical protein